MAQPKSITLDNFNLGGLADSQWSGIKNSVYEMVGLDPHSTPGLLQVAQELTKNSGTTVTELCKCAVNCSTGIRYWFSSSSGKIWQDKAGTWTLVYTVSAGAGESNILGAYEYQGYIYFATELRLHRISISLADGSSAWTTNAVPNWATFTAGDPDWHPMTIQNLVLYIGDGRIVAQVDGGVFSANALDLENPHRIKSLGKFETDLLIGTYIASGISKCAIFRWNTWSVSFSNFVEVDEVGVNCFIISDNIVFVQAGISGNIYVYTGASLDLFRKIPGTYSPTSYGSVNPNSVATMNGQLLMGFSNGSGNPANEGIYRIGRHSRNYPYILDFPYPVSESGANQIFHSKEIGAIIVSGMDMWVSWKNTYSSTTYGIDKLNWSSKYDKAYIETRRISPDTSERTNFSRFEIAYYTKLGTSPNYYGFTLYLYLNNEDEVTLPLIFDNDRLLAYVNYSVESSVIKLRVEFNRHLTQPEISSSITGLIIKVS